MPSPVKILSLVSYKFLPPQMGGQKGIALFNRHLGKQVNLTCITVKENGLATSESYVVKNILSNSRLRYINPFNFFLLRKIIRQESITHLLIEHPYFGWLGILLKWFCNVHLTVHSHNIESLRFKSLGRWWWGILWHYEKLTHRMADHSFFIQDEDRNFAIARYHLDAGKCTTITYGIEMSQPPLLSEKTAARETIQSKHNIKPDEQIFLFNGTLDYGPNLDALTVIINDINNALLKINGLNYKIIVCGTRLPGALNNLEGIRNVIYAGFVDDITIYFKAAHIFLNPVTDGGGIKTKVVEALGYDLSVISTQSGAIGIPAAITNSKLVIVADYDWAAFTHAISSINTSAQIPKAYFDHFYWGSITQKAASVFR